MGDTALTIADPTIASLEGPDPSTPRAILVVYGGESGEERSRVLDIADGSEVSFGRSRRSTVHIDTEGVSRSHCRITRSGATVTIEDLGSRNGTRVNGETISGPTELSSGDEIGVGPVNVVYLYTTGARRQTRIGNSAHLEERLAAECDRGLRHQRGFALLMLHFEGTDDDADRAVERIAGRLRPMDVLAEYGPDEVAIICPEAEASAAEMIARRLAGEIRHAAPELGLRIGVALFPEHATRPDEILSRAHGALRTARTGDSVEPILAEAEAESSGDTIVVDPQMTRVFALVDKVAPTSMTVLINGETGVGKEVVAAAIHGKSQRHGAPFVRLNCASIPETLLESELFGHERGAFTGAERRKAGYFEAADGGTIFLDEIGEISPGLQSKLLRVLEERRFTRVGGTSEIEVDVRVVCATNRDLERDVEAGSFRQDLFFRISAFTILVPPLRNRPRDIEPLAEHFLRISAAQLDVPPPVLSPEVRQVLTHYPWPGNVRQLKNAIERAVILVGDGVVELTHLPDRIRDEESSQAAAVGGGAELDVRERVADVERQAIIDALEECGGNQTHAARKLGLSRRALIYKMEKYGLKRPPASRSRRPQRRPADGGL